MRVLVIDDEATILMVAERILNKHGHEAICARTGNEGLRLLNDPDSKVDLVLLDWAMPQMSGLEVLQELRKLVPDLPVVLSSGYHIDNGNIGGIAPENVRFLDKPYRTEALLALLDEIG